MGHKPQCATKQAEYQSANMEYMQALAAGAFIDQMKAASDQLIAEKLAVRDQKYQAWITCENSGQ